MIPEIPAQDVYKIVFQGIVTTVGVIVGAWLANKTQERRERTLTRQKWLDSLRERIPEVISTAAWFYVSAMKAPASMDSQDSEERKKILELELKITQVALALDLKDESHAELNQRMEDLRMAAFEGNGRINQFPDEVKKLKKACIEVLKREAGSWRNK